MRREEDEEWFCDDCTLYFSTALPCCPECGAPVINEDYATWELGIVAW